MRRTPAEGRLRGFLAGIEICRRFPLTGVGIGNFIPYRAEFVDGYAKAAHSLPGQLLGDTGLLGGLCFLLILGVTVADCRRVRLIASERAGPALSVLGELCLAIRMSLLLLLFFGLSLHNVYRFNYLWLAAFAFLARLFARAICEFEDSTTTEPGFHD